MNNDKLNEVSGDLDKAANALLGCGCLITIIAAVFLLIIAALVGF